jgi:hypothetical protein
MPDSKTKGYENGKNQKETHRIGGGFSVLRFDRISFHIQYEAEG